MKATWNNTVIAESDDTVLVEGKHKTSCAWTGQANCYPSVVNGETLTGVVWFCTDPKPEPTMVRGRVAFGNAVKVG